jgi:hypothetical protein
MRVHWAPAGVSDTHGQARNHDRRNDRRHGQNVRDGWPAEDQRQDGQNAGARSCPDELLCKLFMLMQQALRNDGLHPLFVAVPCCERCPASSNRNLTRLSLRIMNREHECR